MTQKPIGVLIKTLAMEQNITVIQLANLSGRSRQQVHQDFNKFTLKNDVLEKYCQAFNLTKEDMLARLNEPKVSPQDSDYLAIHLQRLEEHFRELSLQLKEQLAMKDKQIDGLQRTVDVLLGKYKDVINTTTPIVELCPFSEGMRA